MAENLTLSMSIASILTVPSASGAFLFPGMLSDWTTILGT